MRAFVGHFNWSLFFMAVLLTSVGLTNLYSATSSFADPAHTTYFKAQIIWSLISLFGFFVAISIHYRHIYEWSYFLYGVGVSLLILVLFAGREVSGHQSWLSIGSVSLQPTEIAKLGFIIGLARLLSNRDSRAKAGLLDLIPSMVLLMIPVVLVMIQGDLGSSLFFGLIYLSVVLVHGIRWQVLVGMILAGLVLVTVAYFFLLSPYQTGRIQSFLNPELDRRGSGYHLIQSKIAVGSGGILGKGYLKGETHKLKFVPERHTDFIFPVLAEEWGFLGSLFVLAAFFIFLFLGLTVTYKAPDRYGFFLSMGVCALFFWHLVVNLGGVLGLIPLTGVPLPFFSYGGSALLTCWVGLGLISSVSMRRFMFT